MSAGCPSEWRSLHQSWPLLKIGPACGLNRPTQRTMASTFVGLDVGTNAVRAAEITGGPRPVLQGFGQVALPPGAVVEGEVVDVAAVTQAIRKLWTGVGFRGRSVRVGVASSRLIVRVVELPALSLAETRSTLGLQLDEYVPLAPDDTVFDFEPLGSRAPDGGHHVLLAATHRDVVRPLVDAVRGAGLKIAAVDALPAALCRALAGAHPAEPGTVDMIVSIGAGTVLVVASDSGAPVFVRTITSVAGAVLTERMAAHLGISNEDAERLKRSGVARIATAVAARHAARPALDELVDEIADSIDFFLGQEGATEVRRVLLTGGGSLDADLVDELAGRLRIDVAVADPFGGVRIGDIGYETAELPFLAPYLPGALGLALCGGGRRKHLDLTPEPSGARRGDRRPLAVAAGVVLLTGFGALHMQQRGAVGEERASAAEVEAELAAVRTQLAEAESGSTARPADAEAVAREILETSAQIDVDWLAVVQELDAIDAATGITVDATRALVDGTVVAADPSEPADAEAASVAAEDGSTSLPAPGGNVSISGVAADPAAVAGWIDAVLASGRFASAWVDNVSAVTTDDGSSHVEFTAQLTIAGANGVVRALREGAAA